MTDQLQPGRRDCLLVVDVQNDFCSNGKLAVADGEAVVPLINGLMPAFHSIVLTQDWHPPGHSSFASSHQGHEPFEEITMPYGPQTLWPDHCLQGSHGAALHADLDTDRAEAVIRKGYRPALDSYSAFFENDHKTPTGLGGYLRERGISRVVLCGLATDFCVYWSARDAVRLGFNVVLVEDACRGIDLNGSLAAALETMDDLGVWRIAAAAISPSQSAAAA